MSWGRLRAAGGWPVGGCESTAAAQPCRRFCHLSPPNHLHAALPPQTNDFGVGKDGRRKESFQLGMSLTARATLLAEGCRGSLSQAVMKKLGLREKAQAQPQTYALGLKEVWEVSQGTMGGAAAGVGQGCWVGDAWKLEAGC